MKKICEIDAATSYARTGELPLGYTWKSRKHRVNRSWFDRHFTTAQKQILEQHGYTARPHPRHNLTIELFINENNLTDRDWTLIRLLF